MIYLHKILPLVLSPIVLTIILISYGVIAKKKKALWVAIFFLYLVSTPIVSNALFRYTEQYAVRRDPAMVPEVDAIVVSSGMLLSVQSVQGSVSEWRDPDRFFTGVELYQLKKSKKLIFTGSEGSILKKHAEAMGVLGIDMLVTREVQNTEQEARAVRDLLNGRNSTILLVTSAFHMLRARQLFQNIGFEVYEYPVDFRVAVRKTTLLDFLPSGEMLWLTDIAIREHLGRLFYRAKSLLK